MNIVWQKPRKIKINSRTVLKRNISCARGIVFVSRKDFTKLEKKKEKKGKCFQGRGEKQRHGSEVGKQMVSLWWQSAPGGSETLACAGHLEGDTVKTGFVFRIGEKSCLREMTVLLSWLSFHFYCIWEDLWKMFSAGGETSLTPAAERRTESPDCLASHADLTPVTLRVCT